MMAGTVVLLLWFVLVVAGVDIVDVAIVSLLCLWWSWSRRCDFWHFGVTWVVDHRRLCVP